MTSARQPSCDLVIIGLTAVGKSTLAKRLARITGARIIEVGQIVMQDAWACRKCISPLEHADHLINAGDRLKFVELVVRAAHDNGEPSIVVGPRQPVEIQFLSKIFGRLCCLV